MYTYYETPSTIPSAQKLVGLVSYAMFLFMQLCKFDQNRTFKIKHVQYIALPHRLGVCRLHVVHCAS